MKQPPKESKKVKEEEEDASPEYDLDFTSRAIEECKDQCLHFPFVFIPMCFVVLCIISSV